MTRGGEGGKDLNIESTDSVAFPPKHSESLQGRISARFTAHERTTSCLHADADARISPAEPLKTASQVVCHLSAFNLKGTVHQKIQNPAVLSSASVAASSTDSEVFTDLCLEKGD